MPVTFTKGNSPIILTLPYTGTNMPRALVERLADKDKVITAPDRCLDRLLLDLFPEFNLVVANFHRFQSDVDYPYPKTETGYVKGMIGVVPLLDNDGRAVWVAPPSLKEASSWRSMCFAPYHAAVAAQIARVRAEFGHAILLTCRGRKSSAPEGTDTRMPDLCISTYMGAAASIKLSSRMAAVLRSDNSFLVSMDGRMGTGGTTQSYGRPKQGVHAIDLEFNERNYLGSGDMPGVYDADKAVKLRALMKAAFVYLATWQPS